MLLSTIAKNPQCMSCHPVQLPQNFISARPLLSVLPPIKLCQCTPPPFSLTSHKTLSAHASTANTHQCMYPPLESHQPHHYQCMLPPLSLALNLYVYSSCLQVAWNYEKQALIYGSCLVWWQTVFLYCHIHYHMNTIHTNLFITPFIITHNFGYNTV